DITRQLPAWPERMQRLDAGVESLLLRRFERHLARAHAVALGDELGERGIAAGQLLRQRVIGRERAEGGAIERVGARREDLEPLAAALDVEKDARALRPPHPILLHDPHPLRP